METKKKLKKTSKEDFRKFKDEFLKWSEMFNLGDWKIYFFHEKLTDDSTFARIYHNYENHTASVYLNSENDDGENFNPIHHAHHEACHLLLASLYHMATSNNYTSRDVDTEDERLTVLLTNIFEGDK